jgi:hypothetical protein
MKSAGALAMATPNPFDKRGVRRPIFKNYEHASAPEIAVVMQYVVEDG